MFIVSYICGISFVPLLNIQYFKNIPNMGLTRDGHTGNLVITFDVVFPETLDLDKIAKLKEIL